MKRFAEDANYWDTTVNPAKSLGEIQEMLTDFGATTMIVTQGQAKGRYAWLIRFQWMDRSYRFLFTPMECRQPLHISSFGGKRRTNEEQSRFQMGRIAVWFVKAILTAAEAQPEALFGYLELPGARSGGIPTTTAELNVAGLVAALPEITLPQLNEPTTEDEM